MHINQNIVADHIAIHQALHDIAKPDYVRLSDGRALPIERRKGLACVRYERGLTFIQQNPNKDSKFAALARSGIRITWGMKDIGSWIYIDDDVVNQFKRQNKTA